MSLPASASILSTYDTKPEAEQAAKDAADTLCELGFNDDWGVYLRKFRVPGQFCALWALCVGKHDEDEA